MKTVSVPCFFCGKMIEVEEAETLKGNIIACAECKVLH
jgi:hypothetical protein